MKIFDIRWLVTKDEISKRLDGMSPTEAAANLGIREDSYKGMTEEERHDLAYDIFHHRPGVLDEFLGLPEIITVPDGIPARNVPKWLSDTFGYCHEGYRILG